MSGIEIKDVSSSPTSSSWIGGDASNRESLAYVDTLEDVLSLKEGQHPVFSLAKNKARFLRMLVSYQKKNSWLEVAPLSKASLLFQEQKKLLENIRMDKINYELDLETATLTPSQRAYRGDELKMCKIQEKIAVQLITRIQQKLKSGRR